MSRKALPPTRVGRRAPAELESLTAFTRRIRRLVPSLDPWSGNREQQAKAIRAKAQRNARPARAFRDLDLERGDG
jgi:hypothetical protein